MHISYYEGFIYYICIDRTFQLAVAVYMICLCVLVAAMATAQRCR